MTNYIHGRKAEERAVLFLKNKSWIIIDQNWETRWCEIDIIAKNNTIIYFIEVKYRKNDEHGSGLDYVTPKKLHQMTRAAEGWVQTHNWQGDYQLAVIEVSGQNYQITNFLTDI